MPAIRTFSKNFALLPHIPYSHATSCRPKGLKTPPSAVNPQAEEEHRGTQLSANSERGHPRRYKSSEQRRLLTSEEQRHSSQSQPSDSMDWEYTDHYDAEDANILDNDGKRHSSPRHHNITESVQSPRLEKRKKTKHYTHTLSPVREDQSPVQEYVMSGALVSGEKAPCIPVDDGLDCTKMLESQLKYMKWRILTADQLIQVKGLFSDPMACSKLLGSKFLTTNEGLRLAIGECRGSRLKGKALDQLVIAALIRRGGIIETENNMRAVIYPEDIQPVLDENHELYDSEYWKDLDAQGDLWDRLLI